MSVVFNRYSNNPTVIKVSPCMILEDRHIIRLVIEWLDMSRSRRNDSTRDHECHQSINQAVRAMTEV